MNQYECVSGVSHFRTTTPHKHTHLLLLLLFLLVNPNPPQNSPLTLTNTNMIPLHQVVLSIVVQDVTSRPPLSHSNPAKDLTDTNRSHFNGSLFQTGPTGCSSRAGSPGCACLHRLYRCVCVFLAKRKEGGGGSVPTLAGVKAH